MANAPKNLFVNVMTSGKRLDAKDEAQMDTLVRYILLNFLIFMGGSLLFAFGFENASRGEAMAAIFDISMGTLTLVGFVVLRTNAPFLVSGLLTVVPYCALCAFFAQSGGAQGSGMMWSFSFPMMAVFLLGMVPGIILSGVLLVVICLSLFLPGFSPMAFESAFAFRTVGVYALVLAITIVYEQTKVTKDKWVFRLTRDLKTERDEIAAMKDNLKVGLFLLDRDYAIQPQYSKALSEILGIDDPGGMRFVDVLEGSLQQRERDTLRDYFDMVYNRSYDAKMLEDINPIHQFVYATPGSGGEKTLRCAFTPIDRGSEGSFILGTVQDVTYEVELQSRLSEEEGKREAEMRSLFEVIHVEPRVLHDFIEDADFEFARINDLLKDNGRTARSIMVDIYQSVHAIKSNALILGLESFATKLHELEDEIRDLREKHDIAFNEVLHVTVELERIMQIKDGFGALIDKIMSFRMGETRMKEDYVLLQSLEKAISKAAKDHGKKARLVVDSIDGEAVERAPRRVMKEILTQIVRNAVCHGIESPEARAAEGKDEEGAIRLSIALAGDRIDICVGDDGRGLDFEAIRSKAERLGIVKPNAADRNVLTRVIFSPGFSTEETADMHAGRGIGLSLVRDRLRDLNGTIKLQTENGKGTTFRISIPAAAVAQPAAAG